TASILYDPELFYLNVEVSIMNAVYYNFLTNNDLVAPEKEGSVRGNCFFPFYDAQAR
ncbi:hypothetical protein ACJX0J_016128, partial [Zea mays]